MKGDMKCDMKCDCAMGTCPKCHGWIWLVVGIVLLINAYWPFAQMWTLVAWLLALLGLTKVIWPSCSHCK